MALGFDRLVMCATGAERIDDVLFAPVGRGMRQTLEIAGLADAGLVPRERAEALHQVASRWSVGLTPRLAARIDPADPADPLARQFVPSEAELLVDPDELADPIGDLAHRPVPGIVHRYPDRALLTPTSACAVYCRFCFRRERVGANGDSLGAELERALAYLESHPEIWEVILSGGDPLVLAPHRLGAMCAGSTPSRTCA